MKQNSIRARRETHKYNKRAKLSKRLHISRKLLIYAILIFWLVVSLFPFIWAITASFKTPANIASLGINPFPGKWTTENFDYIFHSTFTKEFIGVWIKNSIIFSVACSTLNVFFNFLAGYALARIHFKGKKQLLWIFIAGMMIPAQITQIPQLFILIQMGFIGGDVADNIWFIGIIFTSMTSAMWIFLVRQFYINLGNSAEEAGTLDGLSTFGVFIRISLKLMIPLIATQWAMIFMASWNNFIMFTLWSGGEPSRMTITAALQVIGSAANASDPNQGRAITLAATNIATLPVIIVYLCSLFFQRKQIGENDK
ncbi:carbohydrate ABC transporter permease [Mycoplasma marinum]|uniref:ABC transmembrane type-1 domain-containing protein n=1 Tax=Mycoplasma marinum TaxID=1937190 RepID=A0A4R0XSD9_9MOLU|nr:carbohydrate ABC transporter permease [Mycoplasma marinum]TCG10509.1 hypothetical protein C4B24_04555 [Mycoplasma marinum]